MIYRDINQIGTVNSSCAFNVSIASFEKLNSFQNHVSQTMKYTLLLKKASQIAATEGISPSKSYINFTKSCSVAKANIVVCSLSKLIKPGLWWLPEPPAEYLNVMNKAGLNGWQVVSVFVVFSKMNYPTIISNQLIYEQSLYIEVSNSGLIEKYDSKVSGNRHKR